MIFVCLRLSLFCLVFSLLCFVFVNPCSSLCFLCLPMFPCVPLAWPFFVQWLSLFVFLWFVLPFIGFRYDFCLSFFVSLLVLDLPCFCPCSSLLPLVFSMLVIVVLVFPCRFFLCFSSFILVVPVLVLVLTCFVFSSSFCVYPSSKLPFFSRQHRWKYFRISWYFEKKDKRKMSKKITILLTNSFWIYEVTQPYFVHQVPIFIFNIYQKI